MRALTVAAALACAAVFVACGSNSKNADAPAAQPAAKTYTRDEFRKLVEGKTADEVRKAFGPPRKTTELGDRLYYFYDDLTVDPANGKTDTNIQIVILDGKAVRVNY